MRECMRTCDEQEEHRERDEAGFEGLTSSFKVLDDSAVSPVEAAAVQVEETCEVGLPVLHMLISR